MPEFLLVNYFHITLLYFVEGNTVGPDGDNFPHSPPSCFHVDKLSQASDYSMCYESAGCNGEVEDNATCPYTVCIMNLLFPPCHNASISTMSHILLCRYLQCLQL